MAGYGFDLEGPVKCPKTDFAWEIIDGPSGLGPQYHDRVMRFDGYDDARWIAERAKRGHSTGTTPLVSLMVAAIGGVTDKKLIEFARSIVKSNPGAEEMLKHAKNCGDVYIVTNSYPAAALATAEGLDIPSSSVYTLGHQFWDERGKLNGMKFVEEVKMRSPMGVLLKHRGLLEEFLEKYLNVCDKILLYYEKGEGNFSELKKAHDNIFNAVPNDELKAELKYLLLDEMGIMGGHRKAQALRHAHPEGEVFYVGDSIVDADPIKEADIGVSVNCTNEEALRDSDLNVATTGFSGFKNIFNRIGNGWFDPNEVKHALNSDQYTRGKR